MGKDADDEIDYNPFENREVQKPTNDCETLAHLLKGCLGSGVLSMPLAIYFSGLILGPIMTGIVGFILTYCIYLLVRSSQRLCRRMRVPKLTFDEVMQQAMLQGPPKFHKFAPVMKFLTNFFLIADLLGCCVVYSVFVAKNLKQVIEYYQDVDINVRLYILMQLPLYLVYIMVRHLKYLAPLSIVADMCICIGLIIVFVYVFQDLPHISERDYVNQDIGNYPLYFGMVIFALEGVGVVMPLENNMKTPQNYIQGPCILFIGFFIVAALYICLGFMGCWRYGENIKGSITLNVPEDEIGGQIVKVLFSLSMFQTFGLQFYVPFEIIWRSHKEKYGKWNLLLEYCARWVITIICVCIAIAIPSIHTVMGLVGSFTLACLGIIFPAWCDIVICYDVPGWGRAWWRLWVDIALIIFGLTGWAFGTVSNVKEIIETYISDKNDTHNFFMY